MRAARRRSTPRGDPSGVPRLLRQLEEIRRSLREVEERYPPARFGRSEESARNLLHYIALRRRDLRRIQGELADLGLSSLGRAEGHVLHNLEAVVRQLHALDGSTASSPRDATALTPSRGRDLIARRATRLFGPPRPGRATRIMVTVPIEAAQQPALVRELVANGMDCMRINCAHDSEEAWRGMVRNLRSAVRATGIECRVEMDLGGPRLRTGPIEPGPAVIKVRPVRDPLGQVVRPARIVLGRRPQAGTEGLPVGAEIPVSSEWLARRRPREALVLRDARGARRVLRVESCSPTYLVASTGKTVYFTNALRLEGSSAAEEPDVEVLEGIPPSPGRIRLSTGDRLWLRGRPDSGHGPRVGPRGRRFPATLGVTLPEVLSRVQAGHRISFDAGRISGVVRSKTRSGVLVRITQTTPGGAWLRADQGINLPDTDLGLPPLTSDDRRDLRFVVRHAELVGYSFVQSPQDVETLRAELRRLGHPNLGIVLKIETRRAFEQLPAILLSALRSGPAGVMIARGDLAVEVGFDRLAEVQEETLWLCEAAHLPTVWATEVLEGLAKGGLPTRAEVTDAAMGERAECVMLNKGPNLLSAVKALDSILRRMQAHQAKKSARLRHLNVAELFLSGENPTPRSP